MNTSISISRSYSRILAVFLFLVASFGVFFVLAPDARADGRDYNIGDWDYYTPDYGYNIGDWGYYTPDYSYNIGDWDYYTPDTSYNIGDWDYYTPDYAYNIGDWNYYYEP